MFNRSETTDVFDQLLAQNGLADDGADQDNSPVDDEAATTKSGASGPDDCATTNADSPDSLTADPTDEVSSSGTDASQIPSRPRGMARRAVVGAAISSFAAVTALAGYFGWQLHQQSQLTATGQAALKAAESYAVTLTTVDNAKIDDNFKQVLDGATGEFKDMYSQSAAQLRQLLIDNKAVSHGTVVDAAIKSTAKDTVDVLIFVDQSIANSVNPTPRIDRSRITMTMVDRDGRWLASKIDIK